ncbi:transmembrane protein, putative (macronuclear) [Tetrahymena thermophila SB210]|uniref:Transmembrane protein, putative n=1 Tax=Tetrahymena thermophila (strain SB210) TaxID=312017 RepID=W7XFT8_TETTS|nr:transmembrane protein, putative [Tetrahymena thermophila SB210]EWS76737.1 transmembrane protein, putative [Tetrahymena thermophila SB210]|eukprot:XP_012650730.1 transmembrane protein, putative [Tetrahymena thermophila SB210]
MELIKIIQQSYFYIFFIHIQIIDYIYIFSLTKDCLFDSLIYLLTEPVKKIACIYFKQILKERLKMATNFLYQQITNLDLYSVPFQYNLKSQQKSSKTFIGGFCSLIVIIISLIYLLYLSILYFSNQIQPTISTKSKITMDSFSVEIPNDFITIKIILSSGQNLIDYQKQSGKQLLLVGMQHKRRDQTNSSNFILDYYKMDVCEDTSLAGYYCINFNKQLGVQNNNKTSIQLNFNSTQDQQDKLMLIWSMCDKRYIEVGEYEQNCINLIP